MKDKLIQEAIDFMLSETEKHDENWKGYTTEEWMVAFAKEQIKNPEHIEREEDFYNDFHKTGGGGERQ